MKKMIFKILVIGISFGILCGCRKNFTQNSSDADLPPQITVIIPKSSASIPALRIFENKAMGENTKIDIQIFDNMEEMIALASSMEYSFIVLPLHTAAVLYNKDIDIKLMNVFAWGGMYLTTTDTRCNSWEDLKGKELHVLSKGSVPDILTQYFLNQHGLEIGKTIEMVYSIYPEISQLMSIGRIKYAVDGEPFSTSNKESIENYKIISDYSEEWKRTAGNEYSLPAYGIAANSTFLSANEELAKRFMYEVEKTVDWMVDNPEDAGSLAEKYLNVDGILIKKAMPNFNFNYVSSQDAKEDIEKYYNVLFSYRAESIGGKIPDENLYFKNE